ncbi:MAG: hypothetical protein RDV48_01305 [Candidatus Eremiobacteraeota bacterium]|nr:hypothetical protein [Candidatus Eremiobacteraeota bacterium]
MKSFLRAHRVSPPGLMLWGAFFFITISWLLILTSQPASSWKSGWFSYKDSSGKERKAYGFLPTKAEKQSNLPLMLLLHPAGSASNMVDHYAQAAERCGWILASSSAVYNGSDEEQDREELKELALSMQKTYRADKRHTFLAGHSGGACTAYYLVLTDPDVFRGAIVENGHCGPWRTIKDEAKGNSVFYLFTRTSDFNMPATKQLYQEMTAKGFKVNYRELAGGHMGMQASELDDAFNWLLKNGR